jgi:hypothetical protein
MMSVIKSAPISNGPTTACTAITQYPYGTGSERSISATKTVRSVSLENSRQPPPEPKSPLPEKKKSQKKWYYYRRRRNREVR